MKLTVASQLGGENHDLKRKYHTNLVDDSLLAV